jgi:hypothetical protein
MADAADSKSVARKGVWVQVPPPALFLFVIFFVDRLEEKVPSPRHRHREADGRVVDAGVATASV